jgi:tetratricopeptide (TPR) repeat protein
VLTELTDQIGALLTPQSGVDNAAQLAARLHASRLPTVVVLDDAHDLDRATVEFVEEIFALGTAALVIATTWRTRSSGSPFDQYLDETANGTHTIVHLSPLEQDDLVDYVLWAYPETDPRAANLLAGRADGNPYALNLLLYTPRVLAATHGDEIRLDDNEIAELNGRLGSLLAEHWENLSLGVRQVLCVAALLGETVPRLVLEECLRDVAPAAGLQDAMAAAWFRPVDIAPSLIGFVERLRFDHARSEVGAVLTRPQIERVPRSALRAIKALLHREEDDLLARQLLLTLHVLMAESGVEDDLTLASASAAELAERARTEQRRTDSIRLLTLSVGWLEHGSRPSWRLLIKRCLDLAAVIRTEHYRELAEPWALKAYDAAADHFPEDIDLQVRVRCAVALARRRRHDAAAYRSCKDLLRESEQLARTAKLSSTAHRDLLYAKSLVASHDGDYATALTMFGELVRLCDEEFGEYHYRTLGPLEEMGYFALRAGDPVKSVAIRRETLARRIVCIPQDGRLQTAPAGNNLAASLLSTGDDAHLAEADELVTDALKIWARAHGLDSARCQRARLVRAWLRHRQGLAAERVADHGTAESMFTAACAETGRVLELRQGEEPSRRAMALLRHGISLACLRRFEAVAVLGAALTVRQDELKQDTAFFELRRCASALRWTYERLNRAVEAESVAARYALGGETFPIG